MKNFLKYGAMVTAIVFVLISCDNDPTELGSGLLGIDIDNTITQEDFEIVTFSTLLNPVQTNSFGPVQLGSYKDAFGTTNYDFVSQLSIRSSNITFSDGIRVDSVVLSIPYFSTSLTVDGEETEYQLDSVYGNGTFDIEVFRNNFFLSNFDVDNVEQSAVYYSDFGGVIDANKGEQIAFINKQGVVTNKLVDFKPDPKEVELKAIVNDTLRTTDRLTPRLRQTLEPFYWQQQILEQARTNPSIVSNNSNFQNYFRGLYFKISNVQNDGSLAYLNLNNANITIFYTSLTQDTNDSNANGSTTDFLEQENNFVINIAGSKVVLLNNDRNPAITSAITNSFDPNNGSARVYLKGGEGAMTFIDLFGPDNDNDGEADALTVLRAKRLLINEANIVFNVDTQSIETGTKQPERIFIYDFEDGVVLADYSFTGVGITSNLNHLGRLERETEGDLNSAGVSYKIRLTSHIQNIVNGDTENHRLGLFVSQNVSVPTSTRVKNQTQPLEITSIPLSSAISHEGTVLFGNLADPDKRPKLRVFYTEID